MSKASQIQLTKLAACGGGLRITLEDGEYGPAFIDLLRKATESIFEAIGHWPITGTEQEHFKFAVIALKIWGDEVGRAETRSLTSNVGMSLHLLTDVYEECTSPLKRELLDSCFPPLQAVYDYLDERGADWPSIDKAAKMTRALNHAIALVHNR